MGLGSCEVQHSYSHFTFRVSEVESDLSIFSASQSNNFPSSKLERGRVRRLVTLLPSLLIVVVNSLEGSAVLPSVHVMFGEGYPPSDVQINV